MRTHCYVYVILFLQLLISPPADCEENSDHLFPLGIPSDSIQLPVTSRSTRPISRIAENATIITAEQIALLNAHSLAEVLQTIPGIHIDNTRTPGGWTPFYIHGEADTSGNVLVQIDGVNQGNLLQGTSDPGLIPVQNIERIEIIKGSASASWGAALGGVVNIVTKSPERNRPYSGTASASLGERNSADILSDISGTTGSIGYYLLVDSLHSNGLLPNNATNRNNFYGKLTYDLPVKGNLTIGSSYIEAKRGIFEFPEPTYTEHDNNIARRYYSFLNFTYPLRNDLSLEFSGQNSTISDKSTFATVETTGIVPYSQYVLDEKNSGGKVKLSWGDSRRNLITGIDYLHSNITQVDRLDPAALYSVSRSRDSISFYANSTYSFDQLTLLPGIRYDRTGLNENVFNYTFGTTYSLSDKTLLRGYLAKGYSIPNATLNQSKPQRIWTFQAGIESEAVPYIWLKGTLFYNHIWQIQDFNNPNLFYKHDRQGFELEAKTVPIYGFALSGGYTYNDTRDSDTNERIKGIATHLAKLALNYNNSSSGTKGILTGNYAFLNMEEYHQAHYSPVIWNLHLTQNLFPSKDFSPEVFLNINNIFNGAQYWDYWYINTHRWLEGGVRFRF